MGKKATALLACILFLSGCPHSRPGAFISPPDAGEVEEENTPVPIEADVYIDPGCIPACDGKECGDDGCGWVCGSCLPGVSCVAGQCEGSATDLCSVACAERECGNGGIVGCSCGLCSADEECSTFGMCICEPYCDGVSCGDDGCGGYCDDCETKPCLKAMPDPVKFGSVVQGETATKIVTLTTCNDLSVKVSDISLDGNASMQFALSDGKGGDPMGGLNSLWISTWNSHSFKVHYDPTSTGSDVGQILVKSNAASPFKILVSGTSVAAPCPKAVIKCQEGSEVIPQTILHLFGDESTSPNGTIGNWNWKATQPSGSQSVFTPSHNFPNPNFEVNVAGTYTFKLSVTDSEGKTSCNDAQYKVVVIPDEALHVELLWHTPEDLDETDTGPEAGSDLDLHMAHYWAAGPDLDGNGEPDGWFDIPFDCFWFNAHPNWGSYDPSINDDPGLDRDDTDGAGPENINLDIPENYLYKVGVHYWNDHGYGTAYATVRVYLSSALIWTREDVMMFDSDMWSVGYIDWENSTFIPLEDAGGAPNITPDYHNPYFFQ